MAAADAPGAGLGYHRPMHYALIETALGTMGLGWTERGVARFLLPGSDAAAMTALFVGLGAGAGAPDPTLAGAIVGYAAGQPADFAATPFDLGGVSEFNRRVYGDILALGWGETTTYGDIARRLGDPGLARAVGRALGENPVPLLIPCHRVVLAGGRTGGFSAPGGVAAKLRLLAHEHAAPGGQYGFGF